MTDDNQALGYIQAADDHLESEDYGRWMGLIEENIQLFDEMERNLNDLDAPRREMADHVMLRIREMLERSGVETIADETLFDRSRHQSNHPGPPPAVGSAIAETVSPGFTVGKRVVRRARVRLQ